MNKDKKHEKGLSLIESAMVLAISASVVSGVLYYYNLVQENRKLEEGIKNIQTIAATINKLYSNSITPMNNLNDVVEAVSVVSGVKTITDGGTKKFVSPTGLYTEFWWDTKSKKYTLETQTKSLSSCISYASLNLGTIMSGKTMILKGSAKPDVVQNTPYYLSPAEASRQCKVMYDDNSNGAIKVRYSLQY